MPQPIPVLLLVRELDQGGCERDLAKIARHLDRTQFTPHVACFRPNGLRRAELDAAGVPVLHLPVSSFGSPSALRGGRKLIDYIGRHQIQLVHAFDVPLCFFTPPWARLARVPAIVTSQLSYRSLTPRHYRFALRIMDRLSHRVVVNCQAMWRHMADDEGCPEDKLFLCYNGVESQVFSPGPRDLPAELGDASVVIGSVSALRPEKRLDLLLRAFAGVRSLAPQSKLAVVGSGPELPKLQALAGELGLGNRVLFQPATPDVARWLRAMDIFVLGSESEAFSNALLEAMACGCCPVGSRVGGTPELISEGQSGLVFEPGSHPALAAHLATLMRDQELRLRLGCAAAVRAKQTFSIDRAVERLSELYTGLVDG